MLKEVTLTINPDGSKVDVDAEGFAGTECTDFMNPVMKALGEVEDSKKKPEYFHRAGEGQTTKV